MKSTRPITVRAKCSSCGQAAVLSVDPVKRLASVSHVGRYLCRSVAEAQKSKDFREVLKAVFGEEGQDKLGTVLATVIDIFWSEESTGRSDQTEPRR